MIEISGRTEKYHGIRLIKAIRSATGIGLKEALDLVSRLEHGSSITVKPVGGVTDEQLVAWLDDCGVVVWVT